MLIGDTCASITLFFHSSFLMKPHRFVSRNGNHTMDHSLTLAPLSTLCFKDDHRNFAIQSKFGIPCIVRVGKTKAQ